MFVGRLSELLPEKLKSIQDKLLKPFGIKVWRNTGDVLAHKGVFEFVFQQLFVAR